MYGEEAGGGVDEGAEDPAPATGSCAAGVGGVPLATTSVSRRADADLLAAAGGGSASVRTWCPDGEHMKYRDGSTAGDRMSASFSPPILSALTETIADLAKALAGLGDATF